jgi:phosphate transport system substrate-binding protein
MARPLQPSRVTWLTHRCALALGTGGVLLVGCGGGSITLNGAGASFPAAIYQRWFKDLAAQGVRVSDQSVGSGAGIRQFTAGTIDFGATDVPMTPGAIAAMPRGVIQVPMTTGAIAVAYNNKNCDLKLSRKQLADFFMAKITDFKELGCAAKPIRLVHRSDGSGTTANFTAHLAAISPEWAKTFGSGTTVKRPSGVAARGNEGVSAQLVQIDGGIGYVEAA